MGTRLLGHELADRTLENYRLLGQAYRRGAGEDAQIIESGACFVTDEFIDPTDGSEHLNEKGRSHLASLLIGSISQSLDPN